MANQIVRLWSELRTELAQIFFKSSPIDVLEIECMTQFSACAYQSSATYRVAKVNHPRRLNAIRRDKGAVLHVLNATSEKVLSPINNNSSVPNPFDLLA